MLSLSACAIEIAKRIAAAPIDDLVGKTGDRNLSGDDQKKLDVISNNLVVDELRKTNCVRILASEEEDNPLICENVDDGLIVTFDPLDGSSNIDCAIPTGTIFGIYKPLLNSKDALQNTLQPGTAIIGAGYFLYSSSTELVLSFGTGTHGFTLDRITNSFCLTRKNIICPSRGPYYSLNEGRSPDWPAGLTRYINDIKNGKSGWGKKYSSRYVCSLVADLHRTLLYGGWAGNPRPHLRLLYEAAPLAFITEHAGGAGSDGCNRILDILPTEMHHRLPVFLGSKEDIDELVSYGDVQQIERKQYFA